MNHDRNSLRGLLAALTLALMIPAPTFAQADRDTQEINNYVLTDAGLSHYTRAIAALGPLAKNMSSDCEDEEDDSEAKSLDQLVAKINSTAGAKAAIESAGMTPREYLLFTMSIFQTGLATWGLSQPGGKLPPGMSMANVNFYRKNEAAIAKLGEAVQSDNCDANEETDDDGE